MASAIRDKFPFYRQRAGSIDDGPIAPALRAMSAKDRKGNPISNAGFDLANLIKKRGVWVGFLATGGHGAAPFSGLIIIDKTNRLEGQTSSPHKVGLIAHELTHILQRDQKDSTYWPNGLFRVNPFTRWFGDSTNYMEVLAYIVGWTVEHALIEHELASSNLTKEAKDQRGRRLRRIEDYLATLAGPDIQNAKRYIVKIAPRNAIYRQNYRKEKRDADGRTPRGGWEHWLRELGLSKSVVKDIRSIKKKGTVIPVSSEKIDEISSTKTFCDDVVQGEFVPTEMLTGSQADKVLNRLNKHIAATAFLVVLYLMAHKFWPMDSAQQVDGALFARLGWNWILWVGIGVAFRGLSRIVRLPTNPLEKDRTYVVRWNSVLFASISMTLLFALFVFSRSQVGLDLDALVARVDFTNISDGVFVSIAWALGFFHQLVTNFFRVVACIFWEGVVAPLRPLIGQNKNA